MTIWSFVTEPLFVVALRARPARHLTIRDFGASSRDAQRQSRTAPGSIGHSATETPHACSALMRDRSARSRG
jgi:hypothetical protein